MFVSVCVCVCVCLLVSVGVRTVPALPAPLFMAAPHQSRPSDTCRRSRWAHLSCAPVTGAWL